MAFALYLKVYLLRFSQRLASLIDSQFIFPRAPKPAFTVNIPTTLSKRHGYLTLYFYTPKGYKNPPSGSKQYPLIVNFHGGGFTIGHASDDARWARAILNEVDAVFVSVGYRRGPDHPQPTAVEDGVDAIRWLWAHAKDYGIDPMRTITTGFSAGGNLSVTTVLWEYLTSQDSATAIPNSKGKLSGIVAFYPSLDQTMSRQQKYDSNPVSLTKGSLRPWLLRIFDASYYQTLAPESRTSISLSPSAASDDILIKGLPDKIAIFTCEYDQLLVEAVNFRERLTKLGKTVGGNMVAKMPHGFDKMPGRNTEVRDKLYKDAVEQLKTMI